MDAVHAVSDGRPEGATAVPSSQGSDLADFLQGYGLPMAGLTTAPLAGGEDNLNLRVEVGGTAYVVRRYDITAPQEVDFELAVVAHLADRGFPTPPPLRRRDGALAGSLDGRPAALFPYVDGHHPQGRPLWAGEAVAAALAELHLLTVGFIGPTIRTRTDGNRLLGLRALLQGRAAPLGAFAPVLAAVQRCLTEHPRIAAGLPTAVVHHDAHGGNVLFDDAGRLVALLDFDEAYADHGLTDVARLLLAWARGEQGEGLDRHRATRLLSAYVSRRPLSQAEQNALPHFLCFTTLADAAEYLTGLWRADPHAASPEGCRSWALYRHLVALTR